jgi:hypothetical protein
MGVIGGISEDRASGDINLGSGYLTNLVGVRVDGAGNV